MKTSECRSSSSPLEKKGEYMNSVKIDNIDAEYFGVLNQLQIVFNFNTYVIFEIDKNVLKYYDYNDDLIDDLTIRFNMFNRKLKLESINKSQM